MIGLKRRKGMREELTSMLVSALTPSNGNGTPETKGKPALAGARSVATGAALYATGRALVSGRNKLNGPSAPDEEEDPGLEEDDDEDERNGRPRQRTRVRCLERD